jgi:general stress protein 26
MARTQSDHEKLNELIKDIKVAMLTTVEPDGTLHSRPLATLESKTDGELWFFTKIDSAKVDEVESDVNVSLGYSDTSKNNYVAVSGSAQVVRDRRKSEELWTPFGRAWFPEGLEDPELALLRVRVHQAEYWTSPGKSAYLFGVAKAALTGRETTMGENRKLALD